MKEDPKYCTRCRKQVFKKVNHWEDTHGNRIHMRCQKEIDKENELHDANLKSENEHMWEHIYP